MAFGNFAAMYFGPDGNKTKQPRLTTSSGAACMETRYPL